MIIFMFRHNAFKHKTFKYIAIKHFTFTHNTLQCNVFNIFYTGDCYGLRKLTRVPYYLVLDIKYWNPEMAQKSVYRYAGLRAFLQLRLTIKELYLNFKRESATAFGQNSSIKSQHSVVDVQVIVKARLTVSQSY